MKSQHVSKVLVTGASGFVGKHLCQALIKQGLHVIALSRQKQYSHLPVEQHQLDLRDKSHVLDAIHQTTPDFVVHLAASKNRSTHIADYALAYEDNLSSSINLIEACYSISTLKRFIFLGSCEEYGQQLPPFEEDKREIPITSYGVSKLAVTHYLQSIAYANKFPAVILRPSLLYGPGQGTEMFLPALIQTLFSNQRFAMSKGEQTRDYLYIDDLIAAILSALLTDKSIHGQVINISAGLPFKIVDIALKTAHLIGNNAEKLLDIGATDYRTGEAMAYWTSNQLAQNLLNWCPKTSLETGLQKTIQSMKESLLYTEL